MGRGKNGDSFFFFSFLFFPFFWSSHLVLLLYISLLSFLLYSDIALFAWIGWFVMVLDG